jgi:hypothetical protein
MVGISIYKTGKTVKITWQMKNKQSDLFVIFLIKIILDGFIFLIYLYELE